VFDKIVIVDWSAANQRKTGRDSIWICQHGSEPLNLATRAEAKAHLEELLADAIDNGERTLVGFDFPFGYPAGFAHRLGLDGVKPWRAAWDEIARLVKDDDNNRNNRFWVGAELNRRISGKQFPFWGCPTSLAGQFIGTHHHQGHTCDEPLKERRLIDCWMIGAQPCWKLAYTGSVGSQSLTGIPVVRALRDDERWGDRAQIWPFETGLREPVGEARIVFAEVWPSWWREWKTTLQLGEVNDKAQVRYVARHLAQLDVAGTLGATFAGDPSLTAAQQAIIEGEEAWTLGVTSPGQRAKSRSQSRQKSSSPPGFTRGSMDARIKSGHDESNRNGGAGRRPARYRYLRDPESIYERSFALIEEETDLARFPGELRPLALRLAHAAGDATILDDLVWSPDAGAAGKAALAAGAPILADSVMVTAGIIAARLPAANRVFCTLADPETPEIARRLGTTRSAAAVELWRPHLQGAIVAIGNAPTALFHLLEMIAEGAPKPALVLGFPVGFVGAAEAKAALAEFGGSLEFIALKGRRGGSALAAAAVNALAHRQ